MNGLNDWLLANLSVYGGPLLLAVSFFGSLGIPFPITMVIVAAGALARLGWLDWRWALLAGLLGAVLADNAEYWIGRLAQPWLKRRWSHTSVWQRAQSVINQQGGWAILLTRFWLMPLAPAVNVIAGGRYPYLKFLFFDVLGQWLWVLAYGGLGYLFATEWEQVSHALSLFNAVSLGLVLLGLALYLLAQRRKTIAESRR